MARQRCLTIRISRLNRELKIERARNDRVVARLERRVAQLEADNQHLTEALRRAKAQKEEESHVDKQRSD